MPGSLELISAGKAPSCTIITPVLGLQRAEAFKKMFLLSTNNYHADTSSAGEDASGALSDANPFFAFVKKAKITSCPGLRAQELVVAGMVEFLLL